MTQGSASSELLPGQQIAQPASRVKEARAHGRLGRVRDERRLNATSAPRPRTARRPPAAAAAAGRAPPPAAPRAPAGRCPAPDRRAAPVDRAQPLERAQPALRRAPVPAHPLDRDAEEKRLQIDVAAKPPDGARERSEHVLHDVLGRRGIGEQPPRQHAHALMPAIERRRQRGQIAARRAADQRRSSLVDRRHAAGAAARPGEAVVPGAAAFIIRLYRRPSIEAR